MNLAQEIYHLFVKLALLGEKKIMCGYVTFKGQLEPKYWLIWFLDIVFVAKNYVREIDTTHIPRIYDGSGGRSLNGVRLKFLLPY